MTHNHPFQIDKQSNSYGSKYPSNVDTNSYELLNETLKNKGIIMPNQYIYHPVSPNTDKMPYTIEYNQGGAIKYKNGKSINIDDATIEANENLYRKVYLK